MSLVCVITFIWFCYYWSDSILVFIYKKPYGLIFSETCYSRTLYALAGGLFSLTSMGLGITGMYFLTSSDWCSVYMEPTLKTISAYSSPWTIKKIISKVMFFLKIWNIIISFTLFSRQFRSRFQLVSLGSAIFPNLIVLKFKNIYKGSFVLYMKLGKMFRNNTPTLYSTVIFIYQWIR